MSAVMPKLDHSGIDVYAILTYGARAVKVRHGHRQVDRVDCQRHIRTHCKTKSPINKAPLKRVGFLVRETQRGSSCCAPIKWCFGHTDV